MPGQTTQPIKGTGASTLPTHLKNAVPRLVTWQLERLRIHTARYPLLVTDDDPMSRTLYRALFQHDGLTHVDTRDSREALRICQMQPISLVISDIMKPHMDGLEMLERLRTTPATQLIPLLFITGSSSLRDMAIQASANGFLTKPCHPNEILHEIWRLLQDKME